MILWLLRKILDGSAEGNLLAGFLGIASNARDFVVAKNRRKVISKKFSEIRERSLIEPRAQGQKKAGTPGLSIQSDSILHPLAYNSDGN